MKSAKDTGTAFRIQLPRTARKDRAGSGPRRSALHRPRRLTRRALVPFAIDVLCAEERAAFIDEVRDLEGGVICVRGCVERGEVEHRAKRVRHAGSGERWRGRRLAGSREADVLQETEVDDLHQVGDAAAIDDQDVGGFDVAMNDPRHLRGAPWRNRRRPPQERRKS